MNSKNKMVIDVIYRTLKLPVTLNFKPIEVLNGVEFNTYVIEIVNTKFSILLSSQNQQVIVYSKKICETLIKIEDQWDSVIIGQKLAYAIQKWIDTHLTEAITESGAYGFKVMEINKIGVFVFANIQYNDESGKIAGVRRYLFSAESDIARKALIILDIAGEKDYIDLSLIPTFNQENPIFPITENNYLGVFNELETVLGYIMNRNHHKTRFKD